MDFENSENLSNWHKWKKTMKTAVNVGESIGLSEKTVDNIAYRIGNFLTASVDPENREERVLQELWKVGNDEDRMTLAKMVVKMVETDDI